MNILQMFSYPFMQRALIAGVLVSLCAALLGVPLVLKRYSMIGDGLSHVSFGALAIAVALGVTPLYFSIPVVILAAFFLLRMASHPHWNSDAAIAAVSASALAIGILVISRTTGMTTDVDNYMFGSVLAMTKGDVALSVVLSVTVLALYLLFYHQIFAVTFDESFSRATGLKVDACNTLLAILTALTIVLGMRMMGRYAHLLAGDLPGSDRHAAVQELPWRDPLRRRDLRGVLLRGTHHLLWLFYPGGGNGGGGGPDGFSGCLPAGRSPAEMTVHSSYRRTAKRLPVLKNRKLIRRGEAAVSPRRLFPAKNLRKNTVSFSVSHIDFPGRRA